MRITKNTLFYGDNLLVLTDYIEDECVDLIYLDPPFKKQKQYNILYEEPNGSPSEAQAMAYADTWYWDEDSERYFKQLVETSPTELAETVRGLRQFLHESDMMAYLVHMAIRLKELHRVLKLTGSIYLHCDPTASHYLKVVMDAVFGPERFQNEITWRRTPFKGSSKSRALQLPRSHDILLLYTKGQTWTWNAPMKPYSKKYLARFKYDDHDGRGLYRKTLLKTYSQATFERLKAENRLVSPKKAGAKWSYKQYLAESPGGVQIDDIWTDINAINPVAKERLGYPTQKPEALLERLIKASSNEGDLVLDSFCGCGTTIAVAERLGRRWVGIDITYLAIDLMKSRLYDSFGELDYDVIGEPKDLHGASRLAAQDNYQFQYWALGLLDARPPGHTQKGKKGADKGIDGVKYIDEGKGNICKIILQVKGGHVGPSQIRDLKGTVGRENAQIGAFITLEEPTREMIKEAASAGFYRSESWGRDYPKIQILTIEDILKRGKRLEHPPTSVTFKKAKRVLREAAEEQLKMDMQHKD